MGPLDSNLIKIATIKKIGLKSINSIPETAMSKALFIKGILRLTFISFRLTYSLKLLPIAAFPLSIR